jgi:predicted PurR-regulated permease PerM
MENGFNIMKYKQNEEKVNLAIEIAIKLALLSLIIYVTYLIAKPFLGIIVWGIIIAVSIFPLVAHLERYFKNRNKIIIAIIVLSIMSLLIPTYLLSDKMIESSQSLVHTIKEGNITIPPPTQKVKEWPFIGKEVYDLWNSASHNLKKTLQPFSHNIKKMAQSIFSLLGSGFNTILMFIGSLVIAGAFLLKSESAIKLYNDILYRLVGKKGKEWAKLSTLTIRSVVMGVIGVALLQAILSLIGMVVMKVPFAFILAVGIMFLTIVQLPTLIIIAPVIAYVFAQGSGIPEIAFAIYMLIVGIVDNILKPLFMGRGVEIPMLIILIGAIGGMLLMGLLGLFIGAVVFALAYKLFGLWISEVEETKEVSY